MNVYDNTGADLQERDIVYLADDEKKQEFSIVHMDGQEITLMDKQGNKIKDLAGCVVRVNKRFTKACRNCKHWQGKDLPNHAGYCEAATLSYPQGTAWVEYGNGILYTKPGHYCSMYEPTGYRDAEK